MKHVYVVAGICALALVGGAALFFFGSGFYKGAMGEGISFTVLATGQQAAELTTQTNYRIKNAEQLEELWALIYGAHMPGLPQIDFAQNEVLAVFDGSHSTDGYTIRVVSIVDKDLQRVVTIEHTVPAPECQLTSVLTTPFELVVLPKMHDGFALAHEDLLTVVPCP